MKLDYANFLNTRTIGMEREREGGREGGERESTLKGDCIFT